MAKFIVDFLYTVTLETDDLKPNDYECEAPEPEALAAYLALPGVELVASWGTVTADAD